MRRPAVRLVVFDMDGLMFDTERLAFDTWVRAAGESGHVITEALFRLTVGLGLLKAVATSTARAGTDALLSSAGLSGAFNRVVCGDEISKSKPDPEIFLTIASYLGVPPSRCLVLEDSPAGILAAHRAGMIPVLIPDMAGIGDDVISLAYRSFPSLSEAATFIETGISPVRPV